MTRPNKRGRKPGSGATISANELRTFWLKFQMYRYRAIDMKQRGATDQEIERLMAPLAFWSMDILISKAEALPDLKRIREEQFDHREPDALQKVKAGHLGRTPAALRARRKKKRK